MFSIFSILFGFLPFCAYSDGANFFYSFPQDHGYHAIPPPLPFIPQPTSVFAPIYNPIQQYYTPQPLVYPTFAPHSTILRYTPSNPRVEAIQSPDTNPYYGFAYRTNLENDGHTNVFFVSGPGADKPQNAQQFLTKVPKTENANDEEEDEEIRTLSERIQQVFGNSQNYVQYIYRTNAPPAPRTGKSDNQNIVTQERFSSDEAQQMDNEDNVVTENEDVEIITEESVKRDEGIFVEVPPKTINIQPSTSTISTTSISTTSTTPTPTRRLTMPTPTTIPTTSATQVTKISSASTKSTPY